MATKTTPKYTTNVISLPDLGWMAGIIDLQARIVYRNNKLRNTPQVTYDIHGMPINDWLK